MVNCGTRVKNCVGPGEPQHILTTRPLPSLYASTAVFLYSRANDAANDGGGSFSAHAFLYGMRGSPMSPTRRSPAPSSRTAFRMR